MRRNIIRGICHILIAAILLAMPVYAEDAPVEAPSVTPGTEEELPIIECGAITSLKTVPHSYTNIKLSWKKMSDVDGYEIEKSTTSGKKFKVLEDITKKSTGTYYDKKVTMGVTYYYRMRAYKKVEGKKIYGPYTKQVKQRAQVATATITSAKRASYKSIQITWKKVSGASGYAVYKSNAQDGTYTKIATVKSRKTVTYTDEACSCGKTYYYKVRAYRTYKKKNYYGNMSEIVAAKATPNRVKYDGEMVAQKTVVTLKWKKATGADGYRIYYSTKAKSGYKLAKTITKSKTLSWTKKKLDPDKTYYFKIRAYKTVKKKKVYGAYSSVYKKEPVSATWKKLKKYMSVPYVYGGTTPRGWDCSGFTQWIMANMYGVSISRSSCEQAREGKAVNVNDMSKWQFGDLVFFSSGGRISHVGIYIGDGQMMHALNSRRDMMIQDVSYYDRWDKRNKLAKVRRYLK